MLIQTFVGSLISHITLTPVTRSPIICPLFRSSLQWDWIRAGFPHCQSYGIFGFTMTMTMSVILCGHCDSAASWKRRHFNCNQSPILNSWKGQCVCTVATYSGFVQYNTLYNTLTHSPTRQFSIPGKGTLLYCCYAIYRSHCTLCCEYNTQSLFILLKPFYRYLCIHATHL